MNYGKDFDGWLPGTPKECVLGVFGILLGMMGVELTSGFLLFKRKNTRKSVKTVQNKRNLLDR